MLSTALNKLLSNFVNHSFPFIFRQTNLTPNQHKMKKLLTIIAVSAICLAANTGAMAQPENTNFVHVSKLKILWPEGGSAKERDSLIAIYNDNVIKKNTYILSHREYTHFFTADSKDYMVIEEFKNFAAWEASNKMFEELEKAAWPDEKKRKEFFAMMDKYFEKWHGDALYTTNPKLNKN